MTDWAWLIILVGLCIASCLPVGEHRVTILNSGMKPMKFSIVTAEREDDYPTIDYVEDIPDPTPTPEPYVPVPPPTPEQVGVWTIYHFRGRVSIPTPEE